MDEPSGQTNSYLDPASLFELPPWYGGLVGGGFGPVLVFVIVFVTEDVLMDVVWGPVIVTVVGTTVVWTMVVVKLPVDVALGACDVVMVVVNAALGMRAAEAAAMSVAMVATLVNMVAEDLSRERLPFYIFILEFITPVA